MGDTTTGGDSAFTLGTEHLETLSLMHEMM